jgi:hypothetical protein
LGLHYELGQGVKIDFKTAAQWYRRAAEQGHPNGQRNIGHMFYSGWGVAQSYDDAARWFRLAAAQGNAQALCNLGTCYAKGLGVTRDLDEARRLFKRAAAKGYAEAAAAAERAEAFDPPAYLVAIAVIVWGMIVAALGWTMQGEPFGRGGRPGGARVS